MTHSILVAGGGGVDKTTVSAALGVVAARRGIRTLVLTVDPAKRLADALGLESLDSEPRPTDAIDGMWAAMLDAQASWTKIVRKHSPPDVAERLIEHEFFEAISARFPSSQSYAAAEEMANFIDAKVWDLVIVDTPPSAGGIGFFNAPGDMSDLVGGRVLRWLTGARIPGRRAVYTVAGKPALRVLDTMPGDGLLPRVAEFLMDLRTTYDGLAGRAKQIERMLKRATTVVVTTADPTPLREAAQFYRDLPQVASTPSMVVFNRVLPTSWATAVAAADAPTEINHNLSRWAAQARHQSEVTQEFSDRYGAPIASIPWQNASPTDPIALEAMLKSASDLNLEELLGQ